MLIESRGNIPDFGESKKKFLFTEKSVGTNKAKYNDGNDKGEKKYICLLKFMNEFFEERRNNFFIDSKYYFAVSFVPILRKFPKSQKKIARHETQNLMLKICLQLSRLA